METLKIGLGTAAIGRPHYINIRNATTAAFDLKSFKKKAFQVLNAAYKKGIRYYDTAPGYGIAEQIVSEWIKTKNDSTIEIATKWGYVYTANFDLNADIHELKDHGVDQLIKQWEDSKILFPNLTTLQIHSATFESGVLENDAVLQKMAELKSIQNIHIGLSVSGDNQVEVLKRALEIKIDGQPLFEVFQVTYNILDQSLHSIIELIKKNKNRIVIKEALANGRILPNADYPHYYKLYSILEGLAKKHKVGVDAIALRFCIQSIDPFMVLSGASEVQHVKDNLKANTFELSQEDLDILYSFKVKPSKYWSERKQLQWN
ncbi:aldo/keto reductase [Flavobacterium sp. 7A]|uniref:aldo/keto reductase n=1 Tax=Flavobacterium sp. 7A TaxID=2940571 RepID=UPI0022279ECC|nr:aldo/keto reductase [Flavobacterium sp. 7A]MCW2120948.1 aryl-alcohol dehydrogenase-like predicted oxidoreductase [Flavobacterium sp. 7A]